MRREGRAGGLRSGRRPGSPSNRNSSSKSPTIISPAIASGTEHASYAGGRTRRRDNVLWISSSSSGSTSRCLLSREHGKLAWLGWTPELAPQPHAPVGDHLELAANCGALFLSDGRRLGPKRAGDQRCKQRERNSSDRRHRRISPSKPERSAHYHTTSSRERCLTPGMRSDARSKCDVSRILVLSFHSN